MVLDPQTFIADAIQRGRTGGLACLAGAERLVYLISEAEVLCDMESIDSFVDRYGKSGVAELADAYNRVGAVAISSALRDLAEAMPGPSDALLDCANSLISDRTGYSFANLAQAVARVPPDRP